MRCEICDYSYHNYSLSGNIFQTKREYVTYREKYKMNLCTSCTRSLKLSREHYKLIDDIKDNQLPPTMPKVS